MSAGITQRDREILFDCINSCFLSFDQIKKRYFTDRNRTTVVNRLSVLEKKGMLKSQKVGLFIHDGVNKKVGKVYEATRKARRFLRIPDEKFQRSRAPKSYIALYHDILLNDVLHEIIKENIDFDIKASSNIKGNIEADIIPDALIYCEGDEKPTAIELELTAKSEKRYRDLFLKYKFSRDFSKVVYICGSQKILKKIERILENMGIDFEDRFMSFKVIDDYFRGGKVKPKVKHKV